MACSFSGDGAEKQAQALVYELRKKYKLPAYIYQVRIDLNDAQGRGIDRYGAPVKMRYRKGSEIKEVAVVVGDYPVGRRYGSPKGPEKNKIGKSRMPGSQKGQTTNQTLAGWRTTLKAVQSLSRQRKQRKRTHESCLYYHQSLLPKEYFTPKGLDPFVVEMNKNVTHSLLDCPGKYSVQVATFKGQVIIEQNEIEAIESGKKQFDGDLAEAAMKAHQLTEALRMKGYEAYEFHDRYASIVTVGSFDSVGTPRADGRIEINPKIHAIMKTFGPAGELNRSIAQGYDTYVVQISGWYKPRHPTDTD